MGLYSTIFLLVMISVCYEWGATGLRTRDFVPEVLHLEEGEMKTLNCSSDDNIRWCAVNASYIHKLNTTSSSSSINILPNSTCPKKYHTIPPHQICDGMLVICINKTSCDMYSYMHLVQRPYLIKVEENKPRNPLVIYFNDNCTYEACKTLPTQFAMAAAWQIQHRSQQCYF
ncbi:hypothetical protein GBAR_LOCUS8977 [Geodia barretti]|uniref:Uncharacterized protein n=1 Tax=Geodia barretti TaxID=519541 RepID=A0AA35WAQ6_GEOBA|nr:hypothetical protein GBAR_LOCUS8977 [Geodia barretti]